MNILKEEKEQLEIYCERCGERMKARHCKLSCPNCGALMDCSDY